MCNAEDKLQWLHHNYGPLGLSRDSAQFSDAPDRNKMHAIPTMTNGTLGRPEDISKTFWEMSTYKRIYWSFQSWRRPKSSSSDRLTSQSREVVFIRKLSWSFKLEKFSREKIGRKSVQWTWFKTRGLGHTISRPRRYIKKEVTPPKRKSRTSFPSKQ